MALEHSRQAGGEVDSLTDRTGVSRIEIGRPAGDPDAIISKRAFAASTPI